MRDHSDNFNTWGLSSNIPDDKIVEFERSLLTSGKQQTQELRSGLRDRTLKSKFHSDSISNAVITSMYVQFCMQTLSRLQSVAIYKAKYSQHNHCGHLLI